ncbi:hypothetical protein R8Z50_22880 [Longispora sp. K20-0274]|uniref:hypothetical protein n=1 Tax=Longispora sp. K20-0274 TaxID=3088255 RepID=UPI00399BAD6E
MTADSRISPPPATPVCDALSAPDRPGPIGDRTLSALEALRASACSLSECLRHDDRWESRDCAAVAELAAGYAETLLNLYEGLHGLGAASSRKPSPAWAALSAATAAVGRAAVAMATARTVLADEGTAGEHASR